MLRPSPHTGLTIDPNDYLRTEDARFSPSGRLLALAAHDRIIVLALDAASPPVRVTGWTALRSASLGFPHGVEFLSEDIIAVANREAWMTFYRLPCVESWTDSMDVDAIHEFGSPWFGPKKATRVISTGRRIRTGPGSVRAHGGHLFICANHTDTVTKHPFTVSGGAVTVGEGTLVARSGLEVLDGIAISHDGRWIAVSDAGHHRVVLYRGDDHAEACSLRDPRLSSPHGLCFDPAGRVLYVCDAGERQLHVFACPDGQWTTSMDRDSFSLDGIGEAAFTKTKMSVPEEFRPLVGGLKGLDLDPSGRFLAGTCLNQPLSVFDTRANFNESRDRPAAPKPIMVSVHLPKTAGTSFRAALEDHFGTGLRMDYDDMPLHKGNAERNLGSLEAAVSNYLKTFDDVACIHGHFLPMKYLLLRERRDITFVTWMRHPVSRLISHYHFWMRVHDPATAGPLHRKVVTEQWSLRKFCLSEELRDIYSKFLWAFPLAYFSFIGIVEQYDEDHAWFARHHLNAATPPRRLNAAPPADRMSGPDNALRRDIEAFHAADMRLYETALSMRRARMNGG